MAKLQWYAVHTKPHKERQVQATLIQRGIETYLPMVLVSRRRDRAQLQPFFANYIFVHADLDVIGPWSLHYTWGARGLVMFGGQPAKIDDQVVASLRDRVEKLEGIQVHGEIIKPGDNVVLTAGPFAEWEAIFDHSLSSTKRAQVLMYLLERWTRVETDLSSLRKTSGIPRLDLVGKAVT